jgi:hypothetical protein
MNVTGLGPGIGKIVYLTAPYKLDGSTANQFRSWLLDGGSGEEIYTDLPTAYAALTADRNDVVLALPGAYTLSAELVWAKSSTHLIGLGGPNQRMAPAAGTDGMVRFYDTTARATDEASIKVTGDYVQFQGFQTRNTVSDANNIADLKIVGKNFYGKGLHLRGGGGANQINAYAGIPLWIDTSVAGQANCGTLVDCWVGDPHGTARTGGCGSVYFPGTAGQGTSWEFKNCKFMQTSETAAVSAMVLGGNYAADRYLSFEGCLFYNFSVNLANILTQVITDTSDGTTRMTLLDANTRQYGWGKWCNRGTYIFGNQPQANAAGGTMVTVTA